MQNSRIPIDRLKAALEARREVLFAYLFGSGYTGRRHKLSDVDVGVFVDWSKCEDHGESQTEIESWGHLCAALQDALGRDDVDVVLLHRAPPLLAERVIRNGTVIFSRDEARRIRWIVDTKNRYCDTRFLRRMLDETLSDRVRSGRFGYGNG